MFFADPSMQLWHELSPFVPLLWQGNPRGAYGRKLQSKNNNDASRAVGKGLHTSENCHFLVESTVELI